VYVETYVSYETYVVEGVRSEERETLTARKLVKAIQHKRRNATVTEFRDLTTHSKRESCRAFRQKDHPDSPRAGHSTHKTGLEFSTL
jgi:hypothetical protein